MNRKPKAYFNWSSGKDAALALYYIQKEERFQVDRLLSSINEHHDRVSMHGLRSILLEKQIKALGLPLTTVKLPEQPTMEVYNCKMKEVVEKLQSDGYSNTVFGDIFLEDLRTYREQQLKPFHIQCHFPLWKRNTTALIKEFLDLGFKAIIVCVKSEVLDASFAGRVLDENFISDLPSKVDPCGENGEFHTFCFDGPIFKHPVKFVVGEKVYREYKAPNEKNSSEKSKPMGFWFQDLLPIDEGV